MMSAQFEDFGGEYELMPDFVLMIWRDYERYLATGKASHLIEHQKGSMRQAK